MRFELMLTKKRPICFAATCMALLLGTNRVFAGAVGLNLLTVSPTGTVNLTSSALPSAYNGDDFYAGVLGWSDKPGSDTPDYFTYCIDIAGVINFSNPNTDPAQYNFQTASLSTPLFSGGVINGLKNISDLPQFAETLSGSSTDNAGAEEIQLAIWDIIYNGSSGKLVDQSTDPNQTPSSYGLYFSNNGPGSLSSALSMAYTAYSAAPTAGAPGLTVLETTDNGQNQIFLATPSDSILRAVPLPRAAVSGFALLVVLGGLRLASRRSPAIT